MCKLSTPEGIFSEAAQCHPLFRYNRPSLCWISEILPTWANWLQPPQLLATVSMCTSSRGKRAPPLPVFSGHVRLKQSCPIEIGEPHMQATCIRYIFLLTTLKRNSKFNFNNLLAQYTKTSFQHVVNIKLLTRYLAFFFSSGKLGWILYSLIARISLGSHFRCSVSTCS